MGLQAHSSCPTYRALPGRFFGQSKRGLPASKRLQAHLRPAGVSGSRVSAGGPNVARTSWLMIVASSLTVVMYASDGGRLRSRRLTNRSSRLTRTASAAQWKQRLANDDAPPWSAFEMATSGVAAKNRDATLRSLVTTFSSTAVSK